MLSGVQFPRGSLKSLNLSFIINIFKLILRTFKVTRLLLQQENIIMQHYANAFT